MQISKYCFLFLFFLLSSISSVEAQKMESLAFLERADTFHASRFWTSFGLTTAAYSSAMIGLSQIWYAEHERSKFRLFNDWHEWEKMDKIGHSLSTYQEARVSYEILRWSGVKQRKAIWIATGVASFFQASFEMLDGYSEKWGFSVYDIGFNTLGAGLFLGQQWAWDEQRFLLKISSSGVPYSTDPIYAVDGNTQTTLQERAQALYGQGVAERFIKDYNGQTYWLSANVHAFLPPTTRFPRWLNVAFGYGAENLYGGFRNEWEVEDATFVADPVAFPRTQQFYLSLDVDLTKLKIRNRFLRTLCKGLNFIKIPAPALEVNSQGGVRFHPLHF